MALGTTVATAAMTSLIKRVVDDIYGNLKDSAVNVLGKARADIKEIAIARSMSSLTKVKTLWNIDKEVSLYEFYYPSTIEFSESIKKRIGSLKEFGKIGRYVIQGTAGQGKSIFLRFLCGQELRDDTTSGRIPLFIELRRISEDLNLGGLIAAVLEKFKLPDSQSAWKCFAESGRFVLLLDAFDEIDPAFISRTLGEIEGLCEAYPDTLQIFITSRPDADIQKSSHFRVLKLAALTKSDHAPFLKKICVDKDQAENLLKVLKASPTDVSDLLTTPLMMTLLVILYKSLQTVPDTVPKFYEELFDVLFYRHDHSKPGFRRKRFTQLDDDTVKKQFSALCFFVRLNGLGVLTNQQMRDCCVMASKATGVEVDFNSFKSELVKTICLMQEEGFEISFIHKSVAQYYAAAFVGGSAEDFARSFYDIAAKSRGWELELRFLAQIDSFRWNKFYELPLIQRVLNDLQVSLDNSDLRPQYEGVVSRFFEDKISLVLRGKNESEPELNQESYFWGWSTGTPGGTTRGALDEYAFSWLLPVFDYLNEQKPSLPEKYTPDGSGNRFIPLREFTGLISSVSRKSSRILLGEIEERQRKAKSVIESEERKVEILSAFFLPKKIF